MAYKDDQGILILESDENGKIIECETDGALPTDANKFAKGCDLLWNDGQHYFNTAETTDPATFELQSSASIPDGSITNVKISAIAGIVLTKLANIGAGKIISGNAGGVATAQTLSQDVTINNTAVATVKGWAGKNIAQTAPSTGDMWIYNFGAWELLPAGSNGQVLTMTAGIPAWV